jgi:cytochrome c biogenesis protein ResB
MTGFVGQEMVPSGEDFKVQNIINAGPWAASSQILKDWSMRVNRFGLTTLRQEELTSFTLIYLS